MEAKQKICQLKDMLAGTQEEVKLSDLLSRVVEKVGTADLDFYSPMKDFIIDTPQQQ